MGDNTTASGYSGVVGRWSGLRSPARVRRLFRDHGVHAVVAKIAPPGEFLRHDSSGALVALEQWIRGPFHGVTTLPSPGDSDGGGSRHAPHARDDDGNWLCSPPIAAAFFPAAICTETGARSARA